MEDLVVGNLNGAQYWQWRELIEEMHHAKTKADLCLVKHRLMEKCNELESLRTQIFKTQVNLANSAYQEAQKSYTEFKTKLETELGINLNDKVIDELTFEVKEAPNEQK